MARHGAKARALHRGIRRFWQAVAQESRRDEVYPIRDGLRGAGAKRVYATCSLRIAMIASPCCDCASTSPVRRMATTPSSSHTACMGYHVT